MGVSDASIKDHIRQLGDAMRKHFDIPSVIVVTITLVLFVTALFTTGFTHGLLLEAGVFLVSIKLIHMAYKNSVHSKLIAEELREIKDLLQRGQQHT